MIPCTHGMPTPLACTECMADGNIPPARPTGRSGQPFEARYPGRCVLCDDTIDPGDLIHRHRRHGGIAHDTCIDETP